MLELILFPFIIVCMFVFVFIRVFTRTTGLQVIPQRVFAYFLAGSVLTLSVYVTLLTLNVLLGSWYNAVQWFTSPIIEDLLKIFFLKFMISKVHIAEKKTETYRQSILSGILLGLSFGLIETYLYSFVQPSYAGRSFLLGSIPLQMVISGIIGNILSNKTIRHKKILLGLVIIGHLLYNQSLSLPRPFIGGVFIILLITSVILMRLLASSNDSDQKEI